MPRRLQILVYPLLTALVLLVLLAGALIVRVIVTPLSLSALTPAIEAALAEAAAPLRIRLGRTDLVWRGGDLGLAVQARDVRIQAADDRELASLPDVVLDVSPLQLLRGRTTPSRIVVIGPSVRLDRRTDGRLDIALGDPGVERAADLPDDAWLTLLAPLGAGGPLDEVATLRLEDGRVQVSDVDADGQRHDGPLLLADVALERTDQAATVAATVLLAGEDATARFGIEARTTGADPLIHLAVTATDLRPAALADVAPPLTMLHAIDAPISGQFELAIDRHRVVHAGNADLSIGGGHLRVSETTAARLDHAIAVQALPIVSVAVKGSFDRDAAGGAVSATLERLDTRFADGAHVVLPSPVDHPMPIARLTMEGHLAGDVGELTRFDVDLAGPTLSARGRATDLTGDTRIAVDLSLSNVPTDGLGRYWPPTAARGAYAWCTRHLSGGRLGHATASLVGHLTEDGLDVERLEGTLAADGVTVDYLAPLPRVEDAAATAEFDLTRLAVRILRGHSGDLRITDGEVVIADFDQAVETIAIDVAIQGGLPAAVDLLSRQPLAYTQRLGLSPARVDGRVSTRVRLGFPLLKDLSLEQISLAATATLDEVSVRRLVRDLDVTNGSLNLDVTTETLALAGSATVAGLPAVLRWNETFSGARAGRVVDITIADGAIAALRRALPDGLGDPYLIDGRFAAIVDWVATRSGETLNLDINLTDARLAIPDIGWTKDRGLAATIDVEAQLVNGAVTAIPRLAVNARDLGADAALRLDAGGNVDRVDVARLAVGRTNIRGSGVRSPAGWQVRIDGRSLDATPLFAAGDRTGGPANETAITLDVDLSTVWIAEDRALTEVKGRAERADGRWRRIDADAKAAGSPLAVRLGPGPDQSRTLTVSAENAGASIAALGLFSDMRGGRLTLEATIDDALPDHPVVGTLRVRDFRVVNAPILGRILNVMALTGIIDVLRGVGITFSRVDAPFTQRGPVLELREARAYGPSIGLTASGHVQTADETLHVRGTVVPFYLINSALGRLPVVGGLFTGGERGGGLFAASYTIRGPLADPQISVNPLSILGPGMLRRLFTVFDAEPPFPLDGAAPALNGGPLP